MRDIRRNRIILLGLAWLVLLPGTAAAAQAPAASADDGQAVVWSVDAKVKRLFDSYTSYEFGNPDPPYQEPLSRLEFALDSWWAGVEITRWTPRWSVGLQIMRNLTDKVDGVMADSDWLDPDHTKVRTVYSESDVRLKPCYDVRAWADVSLAPWLPLPAGLDLRPVGGLRWQRLDMIAFNLRQWEILPSDYVYFYGYPGDSIRFRQIYWQWFIGLKLDWRPLPTDYPGLRLSLQGDWAYVRGENKDQHLLREGNRITEESTSGQAWRAALGLEVPLGHNFSLELEAEYLTIDTTGSHHFTNNVDPYTVDETWDNGVRVWSQQCSVMLALRYSF
ncbi:conserved hypothetical protein [Desulfarculus baarsii DSM 2075]|uniref:Outer membrane protein beta-barrel domain-containing protein n=1 Tax=Desulfarculus baarsii (strain ATCC 33931 / DSM 2075 / LMG 7858 / VKM B-1802 / 2st14) TaxID=644282 RepID=E1QF31_DESB2|nr:omptin family outer membrane protease [Desulfarculus baarsii]ADK84167.1 conserved hypothetical protein [Desulfarculus baarsii DSM 2075]